MDLWRRLSRGSGMLGSICRASGRDDRRASRREKFQPLREKRRATPIFFSPLPVRVGWFHSQVAAACSSQGSATQKGQEARGSAFGFVCASAGCVPTLPANPTLDDVKIQTLPLPAAALRCLFDATLFHPSELVAACHYLLHRVAAASTALSQSRGERGGIGIGRVSCTSEGRIRVRGGLEQDLGCTACAFQGFSPGFVPSAPSLFRLGTSDPQLRPSPHPHYQQLVCSRSRLGLLQGRSQEGEH